MPSFIFVFGRNNLLSLLEIISYFKAAKTEISIKAFSQNSAIIETQELDASKVVRELAGTIKIAQVLVEAREELGKKLQETDFTAELGRKFYYAISDYSESLHNDELYALIASHFRETFKQQKLKAMFKLPKIFKGERKKSIAPKILAKREKEFLDICYFLDNDGSIFVGKTIAVSNPLEFAERDSERPVQKPELMTSIRLARILVNLTRLEKGKTILDPFCGIGSILQEGMLAGYNVIGNDLSNENAKACEKNLEWAKKKFGLRQEFKVFNKDSRKLSSFLRQGMFQAVVTEPYLGPFLKKLPSSENAQKIIEELTRLYNEVFKELSKLMQAGEKAVIILPQIPTIENKRFKIQESVFLNSGFRTFNILEKQAPNLVPFLYKYAESKIERLIYVLVRQ